MTAKRGRPKGSGKGRVRVSVTLTPEVHAWLQRARERGFNISHLVDSGVRELIKNAQK